MEFDYKVMPNGVVGQEVEVGKGYSLFILYRTDKPSKLRKTTPMDICIKYNGELLVDAPIHKILEFKDFGIYYNRKRVTEVFDKMQEFVNG